jgi:hypothetical protein
MRLFVGSYAQTINVWVAPKPYQVPDTVSGCVAPWHILRVRWCKMSHVPAVLRRNAFLGISGMDHFLASFIPNDSENILEFFLHTQSPCKNEFLVHRNKATHCNSISSSPKWIKNSKIKKFMNKLK